MYKCYPNAKRAHMKSGGNFPYLSRSLEVNIFIQVRFLSCDVLSGMKITPCNKIDKPLVVYKFW